MKLSRVQWLIVLLLVFFVGCSTVTIRPGGGPKLSTNPTWSSSKPFFLGGLIGSHSVNVDQICGSRGVKQMQTQDTFLDGLLQVLTFGIYFPRTAKVWCN